MPSMLVFAVCSAFRHHTQWYRNLAATPHDFPFPRPPLFSPQSVIWLQENGKWHSLTLSDTTSEKRDPLSNNEVRYTMEEVKFRPLRKRKSHATTSRNP